MKFSTDSKPKPLSSLFDKIMKDYGLDDKLYQSKIQVFWDEIVGNNFANRANIRKFKNGALFIETNSSVWRSELEIRSQVIKDRINEMLGKQVVRDIYVK